MALASFVARRGRWLAYEDTVVVLSAGQVGARRIAAIALEFGFGYLHDDVKALGGVPRRLPTVNADFPLNF